MAGAATQRAMTASRHREAQSPTVTKETAFLSLRSGQALMLTVKEPVSLVAEHGGPHLPQGAHFTTVLLNSLMLRLVLLHHLAHSGHLDPILVRQVAHP